MEQLVWEALSGVYDPEFGLSIVDMGLVYEVRNTESGPHIQMTLTTPSCPLHDTILGSVEQAVKEATGLQPTVELVWEPAWNPDRISKAGLQRLQG